MIELKAEVQAVAQEAGLKTDIDAVVGFPLQFGILDVGEYECRSLVEELGVFEIGAGGVVVNVVVTTLLMTCGELEVIDALDIEPLLGRDDPSGLYRGEETPGYTAKLDACIGLLTET